MRDDYWRMDHERVARSFEALNENELIEFRMTNAYLVTTRIVRPYPQGEERGTINKAFCGLSYSIPAFSRTKE